MADYGCWPLWEVEPNAVGNINPEVLSLSAGTKASLLQWAAWFESWLNKADPSSSGPSSSEEQEHFNVEGRRLWQALRAELPALEVLYFEGGKLHEPR